MSVKAHNMVLGGTNRFTTPLQQEQPVETLEQKRGGLMDRTQNGLSVIRQLPQEPNDVPRALTIEARGGFIEEKKQLWFASKLNADRQSLSCFSSKA